MYDVAQTYQQGRVHHVAIKHSAIRVVALLILAPSRQASQPDAPNITIGMAPRSQIWGFLAGIFTGKEAEFHHPKLAHRPQR